MAPVVIWILVALATAGVVLLIASVTGDRSGGVREFVDDLRAGLSRRQGPREGLLAGARRELVEVADVETSSVDDLFAVGQPQEVAYVAAEELAETLTRAKDRAVRGVSHLTRR